MREGLGQTGHRTSLVNSKALNRFQVVGLAVMMRSKDRALCFGTIWFWLLMVAAGKYNLATDPEYDSMAPGISIVAGWIPGVIYTLLCILVVAITSQLYARFNSRKRP